VYKKGTVFIRRKKEGGVKMKNIAKKGMKSEIRLEMVYYGCF